MQEQPRKPPQSHEDAEETVHATENTDSFNRATPTPPISKYGPVVYRPVLICLAGPLKGARLALTGKSVVLGRGGEADWRLNDGGASRQHARITYTNYESSGQVPECFIEDLGSRNGTEVNGRLIRESTRLNERDRIMIGTSILGFFLRDDAEMRHDDSLYESATRDLLTGLDNRRQLLAHLKHHLARAQRHGSTLSLLMIDVDRFKAINDNYGHDVGDLALKHLADQLRRGVRESDLLGRWGGEEFAIGLPDTDAGEAILLAERLREQVAGTDLVAGSRRIRFTVSIGGTTFRSGDDIHSLFHRADEQLYLAKNSGRNRTQFTDLTDPH